MSVYDRRKKKKYKKLAISTHDLITSLCDNLSSWIECPRCSNHLSFVTEKGQLKCLLSCDFTIGTRAFIRNNINNIPYMYNEIPDRSTIPCKNTEVDFSF